MGIDPHWPVWRIEHPGTYNGHVYERGDLIDVATLMSWRNGEKLADLYYVVKEPRRSKEAVTAQRREAGRKSREPGQAFKELVRRACERSGLKRPRAHNVRAALLTNSILQELTRLPPPLSILEVREVEPGPGRRGADLVYVTKDEGEHRIGGPTLSTYVSDFNKAARGSDVR